MSSISSIKSFDSEVVVPLSSSSRNHKFLQLSNGMLVMLISDPTEELGACCMTAACGSNADPDELPGLAHLLEHMIFRGNKNFPSPDYLEELINSVGGSVNAATTSEQTSFYFQVPTKNNTRTPILEQVLEGFANMFNKPFFNVNAIQKELHLVNNEHTSNKVSVNKILYHGLRLLANEKHPFHRFATGNNQTLKDYVLIKNVDLRSELLKLYNKEYKPEKMSLVLRGSQSINHLQKLVMTYFNSWGTNVQQKQDLSEFDILSNSWSYSFPMFSHQNCLLIKQPETIKTSMIRINFPISCDSLNKLLFSRAWCHLFGDETLGSICEYLKNQNLIIALSAFKLDLSQGNSTLTLELSLTSEGIVQLDKILNAILQFTQNVFHNAKTKNSRHLGKFLSELSAIDKLNYLYQDQDESPMNEVYKTLRSLQKKLSIFGNKWVICQDLPFWGDTVGGVKESQELKLWWDVKGSEFIQFISQHITIENSNFVLLSSEEAVSKITAEEYKEDLYYQFKYIKTDFKLNRTIEKNEMLHMPFPNRYLPSVASKPSVINKALDATMNSKMYLTRNTIQTALVLVSGNGLQTWYKQETATKYSSKCFITLDISSDMVSTPMCTMCLELLAELSSLSIQRKLYSSEIINYTWEIAPCRKSGCDIAVTVSGFTDGIDKILAEVVDSLRKRFDQDLFKQAKQNLFVKLAKLKEENGLVLGTLAYMSSLEEQVHGYEVRELNLHKITIDKFNYFIDEFFESNFGKLLYHGDLSLEQVMILNKILYSKFNFSSLLPLTLGTSLIRENSHLEMSTQDPTNTLVTYIQTGVRENTYDRTMTALCSYLMSLTLVQDLRNRRQLGYAVIGGMRIMRRTIGLHIGIVSGDYTPELLDAKIEEYLSRLCDNYSQMTISNFELELQKFIDNYKIEFELNLSVCSRTLTASTNIDEMNSSYRDHKWYWEQCDTGFKDDIDISIVRNLTQLEFVKFFQKMTRISIYIKTELTREQIKAQNLSQRLKYFLNIHDLQIPDSKLDEIVEQCDYKESAIVSKLMKYFISNGSSLKIITLILKETFGKKKSI